MPCSIRVTQSNGTVLIEVRGYKKKEIKRILKREISRFTDEKVEIEIMPRYEYISSLFSAIPIRAGFAGTACFNEQEEKLCSVQ